MREKLPIPNDLQQKRNEGQSYRDLAKTYDVSIATIKRWLDKIKLAPGDTAEMVANYEIRRLIWDLHKWDRVTIRSVTDTHATVSKPGRLNSVEVPLIYLKKVL